MKLKSVEMEVEPKVEDTRELLNVGNTKLNDLIILSKDMQLKCKDHTIEKATSENNCRFNDFGGLTFYSKEEDTIKRLPMSRFALSQLSAKIGVPVRYIEKCIESGRFNLAQRNVNEWLFDYNKDLFIREYDEGIRGILSTKYSVCDTHEILDVVDSVMDLSSMNIKGSYLSPERFHLRLVQKEKMNVDGEDLFAGITIDSSDVGRSILTVNFLVFKQVCTNGLIVSKNSSQLFKQKHIGITAEAFAEGLKSSLEVVPQIITDVEDRINKTRNEETFKVIGLTDDEMQDLVNHIKNTASISEENAKKVIDIMRTDRYEANKWGYVNALTDVAKDLTLERRLDLERYAGTLLVA